MENARLAMRIKNWFYRVDPFNGCPEDEALKSTLLLLHECPKAIIDEMQQTIEDYDLDGWKVKEAKQIINVLLQF